MQQEKDKEVIRKLLKMAIIEVLSYLKNKVAFDEIPDRISEKIKYGEKCYEETFIKHKDFFLMLKDEYNNTLTNSDFGTGFYYTKLFLKFLLKREYIKKPIIENDITYKSINSYIPLISDRVICITNEYLKRANSFTFNNLHFENFANDFINEFFNSERGTQIIVPLVGFDMDSESLTLDENVSIRKITDEEREFMYNTVSAVESKNAGLLSNIKYKITYFVPSNKPGKSKSENGAELVRNVIYSLRLCKKGYFFAYTMYGARSPITNTHFSSEISSYSFLDEHRGVGLILPEYKLEEKYYNDLKLIYKQLTNSNLNDELKQLKIGIRKYNQSFSREKFEDSIIDYAICLESTLMGDIRSANYHHLALRGTYILREIKLGYNNNHLIGLLFSIRNDVVHNGFEYTDIIKKHFENNRKNNEIKSSEIKGIFEEIVRNILKVYLFKIKAKVYVNSINKEIDEKVLKLLEG